MSPKAVVRVVRKVSSTRTFAKLAPHVIPAMDNGVHRLTRGRVLPSAWMLPGLILKAKGAKSGRTRRTPLGCMPEKDGSFIVIGSNFGRPGHPAWSANLLADPDVAVDWKGREIPVRARLLEGEERAAVWAAALRFWPPYATYQARIDREIRLFRLVPRTASDAEPRS